ncbi:MAG: hypothetical protein F6K65_28890 [Moorea sp. SIO3C2]|nr:hypothetical protein [Moorena sp. SIO3C2]
MRYAHAIAESGTSSIAFSFQFDPVGGMGILPVIFELTILTLATEKMRARPSYQAPYYAVRPGMLFLLG